MSVAMALQAGGTSRDKLMRLISIAGLPALVALGYLASNYLAFGYFSTTASYAKAVTPSFGHFLETLTSQLRLSRPRTAAFMVTMIGAWPMLAMLRRFVSSRSLSVLAGLFAAQCLVFLADAATLHSLRSWYFTIPVVTTFMIAIILGACLSRQARGVWRNTIAVAVSLFTTAGVSGYAWQACVRHDEERPLWRFCEAVAARTPPDARYYCIDVSGTVGLITRGRTINGDGLVNSFSYIEQYQHGSLEAFFRDSGPTYYVETRDSAKIERDGDALTFLLNDRHRFRFEAGDLVFAETSPYGAFLALYQFVPERNYEEPQLSSIDR